MSESIRPARRYQEIRRDIDACQTSVRELLRFVTYYTNRDIRPFLVVNGEVVFTRPPNVPDVLMTELQLAKVALAAVEAELSEGHYKRGLLVDYLDRSEPHRLRFGQLFDPQRWG